MISKEDIQKILEAVAEAYKQAGREIKTITKHQGDETEILVDNRDEEEIN